MRGGGERDSITICSFCSGMNIFFSGPEQVEMREIMFRFLCSGIRERYSSTGLTDFRGFGFRFADEEMIKSFLFLFSKDEGKILWLIFNRN